MHPDFSVVMWNRHINVEFCHSSIVPGIGGLLGWVCLSIPETLHQQLEESSKRPKIRCTGQSAVAFEPDGFDNKTNQIIYTARFTFHPGDTIALMSPSLSTTYARWKSDPDSGAVKLVWQYNS